jgi:hypothetical protein
MSTSQKDKLAVDLSASENPVLSKTECGCKTFSTCWGGGGGVDFSLCVLG